MLTRAIKKIRKMTLVLISVSGVPLCAQEGDSSNAETLEKLMRHIESLEFHIRVLESDLNRLKQERSDSARLVQTLLAYAGEGNLEPDDDPRLRRLRLNSLLRALQEQPGVLAFNGSLTTSAQLMTVGSHRLAAIVGSLDLLAYSRLGPGTLVFINLEAGSGQGPDTFLKPLSSLNGDVTLAQDDQGLDRLHVLEAWIEHVAWQQQITFTAGKIDLTNYFDNNAVANDETSQFLSSGFVNSAAFAAPASSPGLRLHVSLTQSVALQAALVKPPGASSFVVGSARIRISPSTPYAGAIRLYAYRDYTTTFSSGAGVSMDQKLLPSLTVFGRWTSNSPGLARAFGVTSSWSAGTEWRFMLGGDTTVAGFGFGTSTRSELPEREHLAEAYFRKSVNSWISSSLHIQTIWNAGGLQKKPVVLAGLRMQFDF